MPVLDQEAHLENRKFSHEFRLLTNSESDENFIFGHIYALLAETN